MKIGLLAVGYQCRDTFNQAITPWLDYKYKHQNLSISIAHCCFKENYELGKPLESPDGSHKLFEHLFNSKQIDHYVFSEQPLTEHEARNKCVEFFLNSGDEIDWIISLGMDEVFTEEEIGRLFDYLDKSRFITWFSIEYKNLIFTEKQYISGSFPRIFKVRDGTRRFLGFYYDDDVMYVNTLDHSNVNYKNLPTKKIPENLVNPLHYTWLNNIRSKEKVRYQEKHFGHYAGCSFKWNNETNELEFNKKYYELTKQPLPEISYIE